MTFGAGTIRAIALLLACALAGLAGCRPGEQGGPAQQQTQAPLPSVAPATLLGTVPLEGRTDHGGVQVYIPGTSLISITDAAGAYQLSNIPPNNYELHARAEGYATKPIATIQIPAEASPKSYTLATATLALTTATATATAAQANLGALRGQLTVAGTEPEVSAGVDWTGSIIQLPHDQRRGRQFPVLEYPSGYLSGRCAKPRLRGA